MDLGKQLGEDVFENLKAFSSIANEGFESKGISHSNDQKRWFYFIVSVFNNDVAPDEMTIQRWL